MAGLDDLLAQIPVQDLAQHLGADSGEVNSAVETLVPVLVSSLSQNAADSGQANDIMSAATAFAAKNLLGSVGSGADHNQGADLVSQFFGGNDVNQVASQLSGAGAGNSNLIQRLLPMLLPLVLAYVGKQISQKQEPAQQTSGGGLGDVLGSILGGAAGGGGGQSMGSILGNMIGGKTGGAIGDVLGGLLGGKK